MLYGISPEKWGNVWMCIITGTLHFSSDVVDAPHLGRVKRDVELHLSNADGSAFQCVTQDLACIRRSGIGPHRSRKPAGAAFHFLFCPVLIGCAVSRIALRDAAALHMREAGIRIATQVQVGIEDRSAPVRCGLGVNVGSQSAARDHRLEKFSSFHASLPY